MFIHEMTQAECRSALEQTNFGRLACARDNQPYVVPVYYVYDDDYLYGFATLGQKIEWMRLNPSVCLEIDDRINDEQWMSVVVFGRYEELPDTPENKRVRARAQQLLQRRARWWEPAFVGSAHRDVPHSLIPISYRIRIQRITGKRATPDTVDASGPAAKAAPVQRNWLARLLGGR